MSFSTGLKIGAGITCGGCLMIVLVVGGLTYIGQKGVETARKTTSAGNITKPPAPSTPSTPSDTWQYAEESDPMGRGTIKYAHVESVNTVNFSFPYQGDQRATLTIRKHPKHGKDVILAIEKGQFNVGIDDCTVNVRFDDGKPRAFSAVGPADHSSTSLFLRNYPTFVASAKKAKKIFVEAPFWQEGMQVFEFDTTGLIWD